ncbi:MAG: helix-turn-helix domain-containing protein [Betaproteobacteria bacterium]|nr:helix-turn-helix domain-containing protein [Betaproteobacteria bacterium]
METKTATTIFEVLTSDARLAIFRLLVKYAPDGLVAGEISRMLDIPKTNLSFHLKNIVHSGLASVVREGRNTRYKANIPLMMKTIAYLTEECCSGNLGQCRGVQTESEIMSKIPPACCEG